MTELEARVILEGGTSRGREVGGGGGGGGVRAGCQGELGGG